MGVKPGGKPLSAKTFVAIGVGGSIGRVAVGDDRGGPAQGFIVAVAVGPTATFVGKAVGTVAKLVAVKR